MTVHIDDAGWGCLLRGVIIGAYRIETGQYAWREVPVAMFQGDAFGRKEYLDGAVGAVREVMADLGTVDDEPVLVCTGNVHDRSCAWLASQGYAVGRQKIEGPLQEQIETTLQQRLANMGVRIDFETLTTKQGLAFYLCLKWLKGGNIDASRALREREMFAKTGWPTYGIWTTHPHAEAKELAARFKAGRNRGRRDRSW